MQVKSGKELMSLVQLSRTFGWSSTKATFIGFFKAGPAGQFPFAGFVILRFGGIMVL